MTIHRDECRAAGISESKVRKLAIRLQSCANEAKSLGVTIFGGAHSGSLRIHEDPNNVYGRALILAGIEGPFDGGDGGCYEDEAGLLRGE